MSKSTAEGEPIHVEDADHLDELIAENAVVLVDYYADWCGPCKMLEPTVEEIAAETEAVVLKVDIDELQALAQDRGIRSVPTLEFYANGEQAERLIGVQDKSNLVEIIDDLS
ncbi:thioredoxin [Haloplanus rubicundus]|uniref:Thioredoxin n=1 Tax=Haloplanus rubicundus TaxID=1547898 RepID=A0A345E6F6_9EURY|nr:thioredoxin [Haloplanus rubicundus]AXG07778.1 thioredoxin [Haloplanus rubicundus]AXG11195.1 thioredoxin [Haloplanus rubicundus]